jgi:hypothetical protein
MRQTLMMIVTKVKNDSATIAALKLVLTPGPYTSRFVEIPSLHFSSMSMTEGTGATYFLWESNFDGETEAYLRLAVKVAGAELKEAYQHCDEFENHTDLYTYLNAHVVEPNIYHIGAPGLTVRRIKAERCLVKTLECFLDKTHPGSFRSGTEAQKYLQQCTAAHPKLRWSETPEGHLPWWNLAWRWICLLTVAAITLILLILLLPLTAVAAAVLRRAEKREFVEPPEPPENLDALLRHEDHGIQNHLVSVIDVKPGRSGLLRFLLWGGAFRARVQTKGTLGGIPGIFFAHWSLIDNDKKLIFVTNYGGAWDSYLDDFIDLASWQLTPVWTNTVGFPRTRLLFFGGSRDRTAFKSYVRRHQSLTRVWYRAYPDLTLQNVIRNSAIRDGLFRRMNTEECSAWLKLL